MFRVINSSKTTSLNWVFVISTLSFMGCESITNAKNLQFIHKGMTLQLVDSIMGNPKSITQGTELLDTNCFMYNYSAGMSASSDYGILFNKQDSIVVEVLQPE